MVHIGTRANAQRTRRAIPAVGAIFHRSDWMQSGDDPALSPTVFMVEQPPHATLVPHFHRNNQFQLFVEGKGTIGPHEIGPVTVHYAGAYTGYGPLASGAEGIKYLTIRPVFETGFIDIGDRDKMVRGPKRHARSDQARIGDIPERPLDGNRDEQVLIPTTADGLGALLVRLAPGETYETIAIPASQGRFLVVLSGAVGFQDSELGKWESLFVQTDEADVRLTAGPAGAELVVLHTPHKDAAYA